MSEATVSGTRVEQLKSELENLEQMELMLDQQILWVEQSIQETKDNCNKYPFDSRFVHRGIVGMSFPQLYFHLV